MRRMPGASALLMLAVLTSCDDEPKPQPQAVTWHKDVGPLVQQKCGGCHVEGGIGPSALQTYADAHARREAIKSAVQSRHMPPWPPSNECAQYLDDRSLSDEQLALITRWVDAGGPEGNPADAPGTPAPPPGGLSRVDATLQMPTEYTPQKAPDDYRCFVLDWPYADTRYVTGFRANPGNMGIVHHVIAFLALPSQVAEAQALDDKEEGPGYTCFGGPGLNGGQVAWLGSWAPGSPGMDYPAGTGLLVQGGSKVILQVHYNTGHGLHGEPAGGPDRTSVAFKVDSSVDKVAFVQPWANPEWVTQKTMNIPAGQADVVHDWAFDPTSIADVLTGGLFKKNEPLTVHSVALHMHTLGTSTRLEIQRPSSGRECLLDIPRWDFHWQASYTLTQSRVIQPGDTLRLECHWNNSAPGAAEANWGEGTGDEMCLGLFYMTQ
ncbi:copper type II ascorbate-dependent monooxygenase-like protein [Archangium gephyra]|uniref:Copper type II ascorbate-dependent monooxygenase-like protein n=1 Tax=Archangium gephyra TaxID=48 RepID=A0AAC8Q069_9BACT|nr:hypothetical protein [Archangium gephyra]AKI98624.1 Hypothetical protein AA314_00251 [Archangium gephyra]REG30556.1 copper type II ascorbate-dependent monooxygenase-like protein [Archangium gephyra]